MIKLYGLAYASKLPAVDGDTKDQTCICVQLSPTRYRLIGTNYEAGIFFRDFDYTQGEIKGFKRDGLRDGWDFADILAFVTDVGEDGNDMGWTSCTKDEISAYLRRSITEEESIYQGVCMILVMTLAEINGLEHNILPSNNLIQIPQGDPHVEAPTPLDGE